MKTKTNQKIEAPGKQSPVDGKGEQSNWTPQKERPPIKERIDPNWNLKIAAAIIRGVNQP